MRPWEQQVRHVYDLQSNYKSKDNIFTEKVKEQKDCYNDQPAYKDNGRIVW